MAETRGSEPSTCNCGSHKLAPFYHRPDCPAANHIQIGEPSQGAHTPGPWKLGREFRTSARGSRMSIQGATGQVASAVGESIEECAANAELIAKAPKLLVENKDLHKEIQRLRQIVLESDDLVRAEQAEDRLAELQSERMALLEALTHIRSVVGSSTEAWHIADGAIRKAEQS